MDNRKTGIMVPAVLAGFCLAAALGCSGKNRYTQPYVPSFVGTSQVAVGATVYQEAAVGDQVTISGSNFSGITNVSFGGQPSVDFNVTSGFQILSVVPDMAITGPIMVQNPAGIGTSYASLIVTPAITTIELTWNTDAKVPVLLATLTGTGFYNASSLTFGTETPGQPGATTFTYINPDQLTAVVGADVAPGPVTVTLTTSVLTGSNADGTAATPVPVTTTAAATVTAAPTPAS